MDALARSVLSIDAGNECIPQRWKLFSTFFSCGAAQQIADYLERLDLHNCSGRHYSFYEEPTHRKQEDDTYILYQVMYGMYKVIPEQQTLIKVIMERSTQLLNEECLPALIRLQPHQQKTMLDFCKWATARHGDMTNFVQAACRSMQ